MEIVFLGTGTSQGVPMIGCDCAVCRSTDPRNNRTRASIFVEMGGLRVQVDAAPELRLQCVREGIMDIDFFILTHGHADHVVGMDDLRRFCDRLGGAKLPVYSTDEGLSRILSVFPYAILERPLVRGYPAFDLREMPELLEFPQGTIRATLLPHGGVTTLGLIFAEKKSGKRFVYYTDCKHLPVEAIELARGADVVVLDGLREKPHPSHMSIAEAVQAASEIGAPRTLITHLTHLNDHAELAAALPKGVEPAWDGLRVNL